MKKPFFMVTVLFASFLLMFSPINAGAIGNAHEHEHEIRQAMSQPAEQFKNEMRKLWIDHAIWTHDYIVSAISGSEDQKKVLARLLKVQDDLGNAIKPYYGDRAGNKLSQLLRQHILIAGSLVEAVKTGNQANQKKYNAEWYKNADDIAQFLSTANPNWTKEQLKDLLNRHLQLVTDAVTARIKKDWDADIVAFDKGEDHIIMMADTLSEGIIKQFPDQF